MNVLQAVQYTCGTKGNGNGNGNGKVIYHCQGQLHSFAGNIFKRNIPVLLHKNDAKIFPTHVSQSCISNRHILTLNLTTLWLNKLSTEWPSYCRKKIARRQKKFIIWHYYEDVRIVPPRIQCVDINLTIKIKLVVIHSLISATYTVLCRSSERQLATFEGSAQRTCAVKIMANEGKLRAVSIIPKCAPKGAKNHSNIHFQISFLPPQLTTRRYAQSLCQSLKI